MELGNLCVSVLCFFGVLPLIAYLGAALGSRLNRHQRGGPP
jgi:hypothetical protein